ncbi:helix-turn-helix domain-containing protein [Kibdelosporangium aridum]|uniref:Transcriptional regulator, contains XRE-family HTH domain n=1 Tax=Kibdelosporangium aridum TaxID=2030 RepID=A0A1W2EXT3_KIBAR|nr:helix-turn-helix transcriptional regulator [Kibdelosporangium aridum]SMD14460.1 Transcriptional regulator, contains XRE-family HTH domain [Kibdelosporangium aridum]
MNDTTAKQFGEQLKHLREARNMSLRGLASKSGVDSGSLTRIEHGKVCHPQPDTLKCLADALDLPLADLFVMAGYITPSDLPNLSYYLRAKYPHLPQDVLGRMEQELHQVIDKHAAQALRELMAGQRDQKGGTDQTQ